MATEEEAREAADGEEVEMEAADLGTDHLHMNLDRKLSSHEEIADEAYIMDSTEGLLNVTEDQVSEKTPSAVEIPPEHAPNGTASSLNGHMKEEKISNQKPHENGQDKEQAEASPDGVSTDQINRSNGEDAIDSLGHSESTTEDTSLLKHENEELKEHYQQDVEGAGVEDKMVYEDTLQTDEPAVDAQQGQNLEPVEVTEDIQQHASTSCFPHNEVVAEEPAGFQTSLEPNIDDSNALRDTTDGNTETEPAKVDEENRPEDEDIAEHTNEMSKLEDQPNKQTDGVDADLVREEMPKSKKTDVPEDMAKTEQTDDLMNGDQEEVKQESPEDTSDPVCERTEETSHESSVSASEETTPEHDVTSREPALDGQVEENKGLAEEKADAREVDAEKTFQQSGVAIEETTPEDTVATIEPSSDIQHLNNVESEKVKGLEDANAEASIESNVTKFEDAAQGKEATEDIQPVQGLEEEPKGTGTVKMDEASNQPHANVLDNLAEEDGVPPCQPRVIELEEEFNDTEVTETQEITQQSQVAASEELVTEDNLTEVESQNDEVQHSLGQESVDVDREASETQEIFHERTISTSEEDSAEENVTAEGPTSDAQEEPVEEIKDNTAENTIEASNVATVEEADQENNVIASKDVSEQKTRELEPEEIQSTEPVETEEVSDQSNPALFLDTPQEDSIPSDILKTESTAEVAETEATKTEELPQDSNVSTSEEPASEGVVTASEITCDAQEVNNLEPAEDVEGNKDTRTKDASIQQLQEREPVEFRDTEATEPHGISPSHIASTSEQSAPEDNVTAKPSPETQEENLESATVTEETKDVKSTDTIAEEKTTEEHVQEFEAPVHTPPVEEPELEETKNTDNQMDAAVLEDPIHEDYPTASESLLMESAEVSSREATEGQEMPQSELTQLEDHKTEENTTASEQEILEPEPAEEIRDSEATEPQSIVSSSEEYVPEEDVTAKEPDSDIKVVQTEEPELIGEYNDVEAGEMSNQSSGTTVGETAQENSESAKVTEDTKDVESSDAIAEEETPEEHVQEFKAPVDVPPVEEPELKETKNTEPVEVHDNVPTDAQPTEQVNDTEAIEIAEIHNESGDLTEDVKNNVALADEANPNEDAKATEATADIPQAQEPELEEIKNTEPVEVHDNVTTDDQPAEQVKETEAKEIAEIHNESGDLTEDVKSNFALADVAAPGKDAKATEEVADMPQAQELELEEIKSSEPVEVEDTIMPRELPEEEIKDTQAMETEMIPDESTSANISELTNDVNSNVALAEEEDPKEHVIAAEATTDIPRAQEPELEEIKDTEPVELEESILASDQSAEEIKATEAINKSTDAKNSELTENVNINFTPEDEAAHEDHILAAETIVHIPRAKEPAEEIKNVEHVEVKEDISTSDLPAEEMKKTEATETGVISESTDISEPTEDAKQNVALADKAAPEEHVVATEAPVDIPQEQDTELEEIKKAGHVEVEENTSANDLPGEEVNDTETIETEATTDLTEVAALADKPVSDVHIDIPQAQEPTVEEINNAEPVEAEDSITADDVPTEAINDTEAMGTEEIPGENTDDNFTASAPLADIPQAPEQAAVEDKKCTDTTKNQEEPQQSIVSTAAELTAIEENTTLAEPTRDTHVQNATDDVQQVLERDSPEETRETEAVQTEDEQQHGVCNLEKPVPKSEAHVANQMQEEKSAEVEDTEAMGTEEISIQVPTTENAAQESSEPGSDPDLLVQSEDGKDQLAKAEETSQSNGASLEEPTAEAEDNAANENDPLADTKEENGLASVEGNKIIDATEGEEASHPSQDSGLEELVSESIVATIEPTSDIQQVNDLDEVKEMTANEAIDDEETSRKKTEVATLEDPSPADNATSQKQKDESSDLGEKTAFTTQEGESPTVEDVIQISDEDTVGISNNTEQIEEQSKAITEQDAIQSGDHADDQDNEQLHDVELPMQVCDRSLDVSAIEQPDENVQKVNLDQQQNEDEAIEKQTEEIQADEQQHDDSTTDLTTETLLEPQSSEIGTPNLHEDADVFEAEQTETMVTEVLMNEQTKHIPQGSIPSIADVEAEKSTETEEMSEQENAPNNTERLYADAEDAKGNIAKPSTDEQDGTIHETINEETPTLVPQNVEPKVHGEEEGCINNVNDDMQDIQASEQEIVDEVKKKQEMRNEDTDVNNDAIQTKPVDEEASVLRSSDSTDTEVDDTMSHYAEMVHGKIDPQPTEIEEVEQDLSIHSKVEDDNLITAEQNGAEVETSSNEEMPTSYKAVTEAVKFYEATADKASGAEEALSDENLETFEDNRRNLEASSVVTASGESMNEDKEHHNLALPAHSGVDGDTTEQASGLEVTERGLLFPEKTHPTESEEQEESQKTKQQDEEDVHEQETGDPEKQEKEAEQSDLPVSNFLMNLIMGKESTEPEGNLEFAAETKQEETTKDDSCLITSQQGKSLVPIPADLKVDDKLIFEQGKHHLEGSEETHDSKLENDEELSRNTHDLEAPVCQNNVQGEISSELVPGGPGMMTEEETRDAKLGEKATNSVCQEHTEAGTQIEEGSLKSNLDDSTNPKASQDDTLEEDQHESLPEDRSSGAVVRQTLLSTEPDMGAEKKLPNDIDHLQSPLSTKREESTESSIMEAESTTEAELENEVEKEEDKQHTTNTGKATEGQTEKSHDNSQKGIEAISDAQTDEITEPVMGTEINLVHEKDISSGSECQDEKQSYKLSNSELDNSEKPLEIQSNGSSLHINQNKEDEFAGEKILMEENNLLVKPGESILQEEQETEIGQESPKESDGGDQNCLPIIEPVIKEEDVNSTVESHVQTVNTKSNEEQETFKSQVQGRDLNVVSAEEDTKNEENVVEMAKPEFSTDGEQSPKKDRSDMAGEKTYVDNTKDEEGAKSFTREATKKIEEQGAVQKVSQRDLNVVLPTEAPGSEESFVDIKKPEFSTDEEQSPKIDESNMAEDNSYDEKTNGAEEAKNFTDEAPPTKTEEREAGQKASPKKHNILSGVGSKVKHQLAKVKKAIIGKPGHTKSELAKS